MALRLHELHPSIVHFPLALVPVSVFADALGRLTGSRTLMQIGAKLMPVAAGSAVVTGAAGLIAQEAVRAEGAAHDLLATHRNLNLGLIGLSLAMAAVRSRSVEPGAGYLLAGLGAVAAMNFTAYLGGKMVYEHGVGVRAAHGLDESQSPELHRGTFAEAARKSRLHSVKALRHTAQSLQSGRIAPALKREPEAANVQAHAVPESTSRSS